MKSRISFISSLSFLLALICSLVQAQSHPPRYILKDLGTLPRSGFSQPGQVSDGGIVAGLSIATDGNQHPVLWVTGRILDLDQSGDGGVNAAAFGVNSVGRVSIQRESSAFDPNGEDFCAYGTHRVCSASVWQGGTFTPLPTLGGNNSTVGNVTSFGQVSGLAETSTFDATCSSMIPSQMLRYEAVVWGPNLTDVHPLAPLSGDTVSLALWVNDDGQATGASGTCSNTAIPPLAFGPHAVIWDKHGTVLDLGNLGSAVINAGLGINNLGQVVGASSLENDSTPFYETDGFLWTKGQGMVDLFTLPGDVASAGMGINDGGEVVGTSVDASGNPRAVYWQNGVMTDLNTQVPPNSPVYLLFAQTINNSGEIVGWGVHKATGEIHAFKATPNRGADGTVPPVNAGVSAPFPVPASVRQLVQRGYRKPKS
jgi:probable HAF family extracellular repeat protein